MVMPPKYKKKYKKSDHVHAYLKSNRTGEDIDMLHERDLDPESGDHGSRKYLDHIDGA